MSLFQTCLVVLLSGTLLYAENAGRAIDTKRSLLVIHVGKAGLFSAAAHEHWVEAPIVGGSVDDSAAAPSVRLTVKAGQLTVRPDKALSARQTAEVQANMQNEVLESARYPDIVFQSTSVARKGSGWSVTGDLSLHGVTRRVVVSVAGDHGIYTGLAKIKQTDFGIQPIQVAGGVVKVKDLLEISFKIYLL